MPALPCPEFVLIQVLLYKAECETLLHGVAKHTFRAELQYFNISTILTSPGASIMSGETSKGAGRVTTSTECPPPPTSAAWLNNQGVECLRAGEWTRALDYFRSALRRTARDCTLDVADMGGDLPLLPDSPPISLAHLSVGSDFLHAVGFYLDPVSDLFGTDTAQNCAVRSAVVWYNLALLLHAKICDGIVSVESDDNKAVRARLDKCKSLYIRCKSVLEMLGVFDQGFKNGSHGFLQVLGMATLNNLAYVLYQKEHWTESQECLQDLTQWIYQLEKHRRPAQALSETEISSLEVFEWNQSSCLLNAMILQPPSLARAA